jgi:hypothetical protein
MSEFASSVLDLENDPDDAILLRVDSASADPLSLVASVDASFGDRASKAPASDSRPPVSQPNFHLGKAGQEPPPPAQPPQPLAVKHPELSRRAAGEGEIASLTPTTPTEEQG